MLKFDLVYTKQYVYDNYNLTNLGFQISKKNSTENLAPLMIDEINGSQLVF